MVPCDLSRGDGLPSYNLLPSGRPFIHLAADVSLSSPTLWAANVEGTQRALDLADALEASHFIFASSIEAQGLGSQEEGFLREDFPCRPVSEYGRSKAKAEELVTGWSQCPEHRALILRIGNIYGPGSAWFLEPALSALLDSDSVRYAWAQLRHRRFQPLYIADLIDVMIRAVDLELTGLYNITGEEPITIEGYFCKVARLLGLTRELDAFEASPLTAPASLPKLAADFAYVLMGSEERCHRCYDNTSLRNSIGPYARWSLSRGLASTLQWYCTRGLPALPPSAVG